jgi:hypothetical protein
LEESIKKYQQEEEKKKKVKNYTIVAAPHGK